MKRFFILITMVLFFIGSMSFADESILIDFSLLAADYPGDNPEENVRTMIDYSDNAGTSFADDEKAMMVTSLALANWEVVLASSSRRLRNMADSFTKEVTTEATAKQYPNEKILGVRVNFPDGAFNSHATIIPPFEIPAYMQKTTLGADGILVVDETDRNGDKFIDGYGVVKNVGILESVSLNMYGSNFPQGIEIILKDQNNEEKAISLQSMEFDGWKTLTWKNPNYVYEVRNREVNKNPLYPSATPMVKLVGIRIAKDASQAGGDIISYFKNIIITFDKAVLEVERDIDEEAVWGILQAREERKRAAEFERLGQDQVLRYIEQKKMYSAGDSTQAVAPAAAPAAAAPVPAAQP